MVRPDPEGKAVHGEGHALLAAGIVRRTDDGRFEFPVGAAHIDFMLKAA